MEKDGRLLKPGLPLVTKFGVQLVCSRLARQVCSALIWTDQTDSNFGRRMRSSESRVTRVSLQLLAVPYRSLRYSGI